MHKDQSQKLPPSSSQTISNLDGETCCDARPPTDIEQRPYKKQTPQLIEHACGLTQKVIHP